MNDWAFRTAAEGAAGGKDLATRIRHKDIVLLHDNNPPVVDLLDVLLPELKSRGFNLSRGVDYI